MRTRRITQPPPVPPPPAYELTLTEREAIDLRVALFRILSGTVAIGTDVAPAQRDRFREMYAELVDITGAGDRDLAGL